MLALYFSQDKGKLLKPIVWLLGQVMNAIFNALNAIGIPNIGLAIIIFTIVINLCLLPLTYKQQKFSKLQSKMSPELKAIQEKYKGKKDNDSMLAMQQETKEVYAKYGVSQTGSCLQLLIQMPILISLYRVIYAIPGYVTIVKNAFYPLVEQIRTTDGAIDFVQNSISSAKSFSGQFSNELFVKGDVQYVENTLIDVLNKASSADWSNFTEKFSGLSSSIESTHSLLSKYNSFLGLNISDSPRFMFQTAFANKQFLLLLGAIAIPVLSAFTQWVSVKLMPQPAQADGKADQNDPTAQMQQSMKTMNVMMPLMSAVFCFSLPAGMGIYWIASAVVRAIQQVLINKHIDKTDIDAQIAKNIEKYNEKKEKMKATPSMNRYANMNTRSISSVASKSSVSMEEREAELQKVRDVYSNKEIRKDSLLAKANMVKEFNEKNNK
ncbi:membrane protein insertase YidC [Butyrivibrio sp. X503]|uniref:YidC/Oxa1 family membrane protein insertase n=1 Tax=Butyrivibrio sp. X503 TaxID=2364878 RepID=UPI000EAA784B|nr:YidC/Oxa1 family membrane protein insertase [Butyrivibrio sp. X503]RKM54927.1 membrane protein insertase YidC [Butyrivibrio sp. X503]